MHKSAHTLAHLPFLYLCLDGYIFFECMVNHCMFLIYLFSLYFHPVIFKCTFSDFLKSALCPMNVKLFV